MIATEIWTMTKWVQLLVERTVIFRDQEESGKVEKQRQVTLDRIIESRAGPNSNYRETKL